MCRSKNAGVAGYAEAFRPVQSDSQTSEWYSYFENDVLVYCIIHISHNDLPEFPSAVLSSIDDATASPHSSALQIENSFCVILLKVNDTVHLPFWLNQAQQYSVRVSSKCSPCREHDHYHDHSQKQKQWYQQFCPCFFAHTPGLMFALFKCLCHFQP